MDPRGTSLRRFPGSEKVFLIMNFEFLIWQIRFKAFCCFFRESYKLHSLLIYRSLHIQNFSVSQLTSHSYTDQIQNL